MNPEGFASAIDCSADWEFVRGVVGARWLDDDRGRVTARVSLPHCWNTTDTQPEDRRYYRGYGYYRRDVRLPAGGPDGLWFLESGGFYGLADIRVDGVSCGRVDGQYLGFRIDVTRALDPARATHRIGIRLTNRCPLHVLPGIDVPDFILYGGLASRIRLVWRPRVRLEEDEVLAQAVWEESGRGRVDVAVHVVNRSTVDWRGTVEWDLVDAEGRMAARTEPAPVFARAGAMAPAAGQLTVDRPAIWGLRAPNFYRVTARLVGSDGPLDRIERRVGFRRAEFLPQRGFFLNGERVDLHGCNRHENGWGLGNALPAVLHRRDAELMREMGLNLVRLSHYPQSPDFLDACDEAGLLVLAEIATWKSVRAEARWLAAAERQLAGLIRRDRHHPAVIGWVLGNESRSRKAYERLDRLAHTLDPVRPTLYAENHFHRAERAKTTGLTDVWGINYELEVREKPVAAARLKTALVTECANYPHSRRGDFIAERRQVEIIKHDLVKIRRRPAIAGFAIWCFADYATLRKQRYYRYCGLVDGMRLPKLAGHWLAAAYADRPVVELAGLWKAGATATALCEIHLLTNAVRTEIGVAGEAPVVFDGGPHHVFSRKFADADLVARARFADGTEREARLTPWGPAARLVAREVWRADNPPGRAVCCVDLEVVDAEGRRVRDWHQPVSVWVLGRAQAALNNRVGRLEMGGGLGRLVLLQDDPPGPLVLRVEEVSGHLAATFIFGAEGAGSGGLDFTWPEAADRPVQPPASRTGCWDGCDYQLIFLPARVPRIRRFWLNEHRILTRLGGTAGAPMPVGLSVARDKGGFVILRLRRQVEGAPRKLADLTPEAAMRWGARLAAIHDRGILVRRLESEDWVWTPEGEPCWRETAGGRIDPGGVGLGFRWACGREAGQAQRAWFAGRPDWAAAFWNGYQRQTRARGWVWRALRWGYRWTVWTES